jgi:hypothetical protein
MLEVALQKNEIDFEWRFLGSDHYGCLTDVLSKFPLVAQKCKALDWQSRKDVLEHYAWSNGCIHFPYEGAEGIPSAKRNEYACSGRKILMYSNQSKQEVMDWAKSTEFPKVLPPLFRSELVNAWISKEINPPG